MTYSPVDAKLKFFKIIAFQLEVEQIFALNELDLLRVVRILLFSRSWLQLVEYNFVIFAVKLDVDSDFLGLYQGVEVVFGHHYEADLTKLFSVQGTYEGLL